MEARGSPLGVIMLAGRCAFAGRSPPQHQDSNRGCPQMSEGPIEACLQVCVELMISLGLSLSCQWKSMIPCLAVSISDMAFICRSAWS